MDRHVRQGPLGPPSLVATRPLHSRKFDKQTAKCSSTEIAFVALAVFVLCTQPSRSIKVPQHLHSKV